MPYRQKITAFLRKGGFEYQETFQKERKKYRVYKIKCGLSQQEIDRIRYAGYFICCDENGQLQVIRPAQARSYRTE